MKEVFDCGGYTRYWNEAVAILETMSDEPDRSEELFGACLIFLTDEVAGINTDFRSDVIFHLASRVQLMLEVHATSVPSWEKLIAEIAEADWNRKFAHPVRDGITWSEYNARRTLNSVAKAAMSLASGNRAAWRCALGDATLAAAQYRADIVGAQFEMPPCPSSPLYDERLAEQQAWEQASRARQAVLDEVRESAYRAQESAFSLLLAKLQHAQKAREATSAHKTVTPGWLSRENLFGWIRPNDLR